MENIFRKRYGFILPACIFSITLCFSRCDKVDAPLLYQYPPADTVWYNESSEDFPNPERGFYTYSETSADDYTPLDVNELKQQRELQQASDGNYKIYSTLTFRYFILKGFTDKPLSAELLEKITNDFSIARSAGVKLIPRFAYTNTTHAGNCPESFVCPLYGDAPKEIVLNHISQLKPVLQENADVIAVLQMGFIGIWGENYYTDYFGDASSNGQGKLLDENWNDRSEVLEALLNALPADRMVQIRYPQFKQRFVYGVNAPTDAEPLSDAEAFSKTDKARIGLHNDCFISGPDDVGTYADYGNSSSDRGGATASLRSFSENDNRYVAVGGETCDDAYSPENNCENAGMIQTELNRMHYSYLNSAYNNQVNNLWVSGGCMEEIKKNLGYRLVLVNSIFPKQPVKAGMQLPVIINVKNVGYASPFNPRTAKLVFKKDAEEYVYDLQSNVQKWFTGNITIEERILTDENMPAGKYDLFLYLPDQYQSIGNKPEYAIRLANDGLWDGTTGYNNLKTSVTIN